MIYFFLFFAEIVLLFFLSRSVSKNLSKFMSASLMFFVLLPGVIVHELSHLVMAAILFVPAGHMRLIPEKYGDEIRMGSVKIAKTDPLRRFVIGISPFFTGIAIVIMLVYFFSSSTSFFQEQNIYVFLASVFFLIYLLFVISNTMFSSEADMRGATEFLIAVFLVIAIGYFLGIRLPLSCLNKTFIEEFIGAVRQSSLFLLVPIAVDVVVLGAIKIAR